MASHLEAIQKNRQGAISTNKGFGISKPFFFIILNKISLPYFYADLKFQTYLLQLLTITTIIFMKNITLRGTWIVKAPLSEVFKMMTDFEKFPEYFPKVAQSIQLKKRDNDYLEMQAMVKSFGQSFPVTMKTHILAGSWLHFYEPWVLLCHLFTAHPQTIKNKEMPIKNRQNSGGFLFHHFH